MRREESDIKNNLKEKKEIELTKVFRKRRVKFRSVEY